MEELSTKNSSWNAYFEKAKMKNTLIALFLALLITLPALAVEKRVEWKLDEEGGPALDTSWNGNKSFDWDAAGSYQKNPRRAEGLVGNCAVFQGMADFTYVNDTEYTLVTKNNALNLPVAPNAPWSINMYVYVDREPNNSTPIGGFGRDFTGAASDQGKNRYLYSSGGIIGLWTGYGTGDANSIYTGVPLSVGEWQMLTATYDGTITKVYKDGVEIGSSTAMVYAAAYPKVQLQPFGGTFRGKIDEFTVWSGALQQADITTLASLVKTPGDLNGDRRVDMFDFAILAGNWLYGIN